MALTFRRVRRAGAGGPLVLRADSGFYSRKVVEACGRHGVRCSITVRLNKKLHKLISEIAEEAWTNNPYWMEGAADVAEIAYTVFAHTRQRKDVRLIVRRVEPTWLAFNVIAHTTPRPVRCPLAQPRCRQTRLDLAKVTS
ncbi:MAG: transposase [Candidatus Dormibacteria bacterium]